MNNVHVALAERSYDIHLDSGFDGIGSFIGHRCRPGLALIVGDTNVKGHVQSVAASLADAGFRVETACLPPGEEQKCLASAAGLYDRLVDLRADRRTLIVAVGGGVMGDLAGFVAATFNRGLALLMVPTTLLAMVDSALGGKTGVNHPLGKNLIGAFHQPRLVLSDTDTLATLAPRELRAGWAEVIKHGVIRDAGLFEMLENQQPRTENHPKDKTVLGSRFLVQPEVIRQAAKVKVDVVNVDERETGERMLLNYGHTLGHAIEAAGGYGALLHGEAVAIGMELAGQIAARMGMWGDEQVVRQRRLLQAYGLGTALPAGLDPEDLVERTLRDKKVRAGRVRWVLPTAIGHATVRDDVPEALVAGVVRAAASA